MSTCEMATEFRADGTGSVAIAIGGLPDPNPWSGSWKIAETGGNRVLVEYTGSVDGQPQTMQAEIEFLGPDRITYRDPGDTVMPKFLLSRVREPSPGLFAIA